MMKLKMFIVCVLCMATNVVFADFCDSKRCDGKVSTLYVSGPTGEIYIESSGDEKKLNCSLFQNQFIVLKETNRRHKEIYAMLLAAKLAGKNVNMRIQEGSSPCELVYTMMN